MVLFISNLFLLKISFLFISITKGKYMDLINYESIIRLLIKGGGDKNLFGNEYPYEPSEVILNDVSKGTSCLKSCNMDYDEINNVTLKFNNNIDTCKKMFSGLKYIKEVDLSEFDASKVTDMSDMFSHSNNIEIIKFGRINTSSVKDMQYMFYGCNNLLSIDITNFDTSQVTHMGWMFF